MQKNTEISAKQTLLFTEDNATSLPADFLAKMHPLQSKMEKANKDWMEAGPVYSMKWCAQSKKLDHDTSLQKMLPILPKLTMGEILQKSSMNWADWGTMQNGEYVEHQKSVQATIVRGCTWLLTPTASDYNRANLSFPMWYRRYHRGEGSLSEQLHRLGYRGLLNPQFPMWLMGFPVDWTILPFVNGEAKL